MVQTNLSELPLYERGVDFVCTTLSLEICFNLIERVRQVAYSSVHQFLSSSLALSYFAQTPFNPSPFFFAQIAARR